VLLLWGIRYRTEAVPLTISEQSLWVDVHVVFAWLAFTSLLAASTMSLVGLLRRTPEPDEVARADTLGRLLMVGLLSLTALIVLGSWVLYLLFGTFWKWEIVETLSLVAWVGYGLCVHVRLFHSWRGRKLYWSVLAVLPVLLLAFWVWSVFPDTYHYFDIPLVRPY
jgi:ABC-type transport system involved in cytochrome c biogenesis permease subunit